LIFRALLILDGNELTAKVQRYTIKSFVIKRNKKMDPLNISTVTAVYLNLVETITSIDLPILLKIYKKAISDI